MLKRVFILTVAMMVALAPLVVEAKGSSSSSSSSGRSSSSSVSSSSSSRSSSGSAPSTSNRSGSFSSGSSSSSSSSGAAATKPVMPAKPSVPATGSSSSSSSSKSNSVSSSSSATGGYSGGASRVTSSPSFRSPSYAVSGSNRSPISGRTYYGSNRYYDSVPYGYHASSFWPMTGAFAAGTLMGSMLHPWGGYYGGASYGYVHQPFSFMAALVDLIVLLLIIGLILWIVRRVKREAHY